MITRTTLIHDHLPNTLAAHQISYEVSMILTKNSALLIVDVQHAIDHYKGGERSNPTLEVNLHKTLTAWRHANLPLFHIRHASKNPVSSYHQNSGHFQFKDCVMPQDNEVVITKSEHSAFINTPLDTHLKNQAISELIICGVLINNSVDACIRHAVDLGYKVILPTDLTAAYPLTLSNGSTLPSDDVHTIFSSNLADDYCSLTTCDDLLKLLPV